MGSESYPSADAGVYIYMHMNSICVVAVVGGVAAVAVAGVVHDKSGD
jgi:hypothetical protein